MSNAKRRHRRRWRRARMWQAIGVAETELLTQGYEFGGDNGVFRRWDKRYEMELLGEKVHVLDVQTIEVP